MMPRIQHASWMALAVVFAATAAPAGEPPDRPLVTTDRGPVLGIARNDGVQVFMDAKSMIYLKGMQLDFHGGLQGKGFVFSNPNATSTCGCGESFSVS